MSSQTTSWKKLSYKLTWPHEQPMELEHTQWLPPVFKICMNSPLIMSKALIGPSVGLWNPSMFGLNCLRWICAWWIIEQSNQPCVSSINANSLSVRFPGEPVLLTFVLTVSLTNKTSGSGFGDDSPSSSLSCGVFAPMLIGVPVKLPSNHYHFGSLNH